MNYARVRKLANKKLTEKQEKLKKLTGADRVKAEEMLIAQAKKEAADEQEDFGTADLEEKEIVKTSTGEVVSVEDDAKDLCVNLTDQKIVNNQSKKAGKRGSNRRR